MARATINTEDLISAFKTAIQAQAKTIKAGARSIGILAVCCVEKHGILDYSTLTLREQILLYATALLRVNTKNIELEEELEALREKIRGGSSLEALQKEVAVAPGEEDERSGPEGLA